MIMYSLQTVLCIDSWFVLEIRGIVFITAQQMGIGERCSAPNLS